jgi:hypothetical protein
MQQNRTENDVEYTSIANIFFVSGLLRALQNYVTENRSLFGEGTVILSAKELTNFFKTILIQSN